MGLPEAVLGFGVLWLDSQGSVEGVEGFVVLLECLVDGSFPVPCLDVLRVEGDSLFYVLQGQVKFHELDVAHGFVVVASWVGRISLDSFLVCLKSLGEFSLLVQIISEFSLLL